ncbi:hypothetical protein [Halocatena salina]|uniref:CHAT domain-containing protein n=1 Tax=Halocatena salina TaxID=2934340 RepID=A0A8U0A1H6_9EURY|nr:hypothetical protein [Halocatena salina]UPM42995.1 hypothetical protein MW046_00740 [Halocatena salina]
MNNQETISWTRTENPPGIVVIDEIDRCRCTLHTPSPATPVPIAADRLNYPVDSAFTIRTSAITVPMVPGVNIRNAEGAVLTRIEEGADESRPPDRYALELSTPLKLYLVVDSAVSVSTDTTRTRIEFENVATVAIGARSRHQSPAGTVVTTDCPTDMMTAVSTFSSALKTTACERSYPTLRGHPPLIEHGETLDVPEGLTPPETGITIELPPKHRFVYAVASLAYYLGARVRPGSTPVILTSTGFEHRLDSERGVQAEIERVLKQVLFLDCLTRTTGEAGIELYERRKLEASLPIALPELYDRSIADQLQAYLSVPYADIEQYVPNWKITSHVALCPDTIETIPFLVNDLAVIRTPECKQVDRHHQQIDAISEFVRDGAMTRSTMTDTIDQREYVQPETTESLEQVWVGDATPLGASKATSTAFRNRLDRTPTDGDITITVVCNEPTMAEECDAIDGVYDSQSDHPLTVRIHRGLSTDELAAVFERPTDFLHYIGHIDEDGFRCPNGRFDARTLDTVDVDAFFLNACQSYEQGMGIIDAGAIGGVVTLGNVINTGAVTIGYSVAKLLNCGFPLRAALNIARRESLISNKYLVVGDGSLAITQSESGIPILGEITPTGNERFELDITAYPTTHTGMGTIVHPFIDGETEYRLLSSNSNSYELSTAEIRRFLSLERIPIIMDDDLLWSDAVALNEL